MKDWPTPPGHRGPNLGRSHSSDEIWGRHGARVRNVLNGAGAEAQRVGVKAPGC